MTLSATLSYWFWCAFYRHYNDFIDGGLRIEIRSKRSGRYWRPHLECSKDFQRKVLKSYGPFEQSVVLGSGRLLDLEPDVIQSVKECRLVDADPRALAYARKKARTLTKATEETKIITELLELTGLHWLKQIPDPSEILASHAELDRLHSTNNTLLLSLNLLSQLPVMLMENHQISPSKQEAVQLAHLKALNASKARVVIIISDSEFMDYDSDSVHWRTEDALHGFSKESLPQIMSNYQLVQQDSWLWHLAPQFVEQLNYGLIHNIFAQAYLSK